MMSPSRRFDAHDGGGSELSGRGWRGGLWGGNPPKRKEGRGEEGRREGRLVSIS